MEHEIIRDIIAVWEKASERPYCDTCDFTASCGNETQGAWYKMLRYEGYKVRS